MESHRVSHPAPSDPHARPVGTGGGVSMTGGLLGEEAHAARALHAQQPRGEAGGNARPAG